MTSQMQCCATSTGDDTFADGIDGGGFSWFQRGGIHCPVSKVPLVV